MTGYLRATAFAAVTIVVAVLPGAAQKPPDTRADRCGDRPAVASRQADRHGH